MITPRYLAPRGEKHGRAPPHSYRSGRAAVTAATALGVAAPASAESAPLSGQPNTATATPSTASHYTVEVAGATSHPRVVSAVWAACGISDEPGKLVRRFPRVAGPPGTASDLLCGTDGFGYRHIKQRHMTQWESLAFMVGSNWRDFADFAIEQILKAPEPGFPTYDAGRDTWTYRAPVQIIDNNGEVRDTYRPFVIIANQDTKIITASPRASRASRDP